MPVNEIAELRAHLREDELPSRSSEHLGETPVNETTVNETADNQDFERDDKVVRYYFDFNIQRIGRLKTH